MLYIGRAGSLRHRVASYWGGLGDRPWLERMVERVAKVEAVVCDSEHEAAWLERNLLERGRPRWNRTTGVEVPVYIRLDPGAASPGVEVVHEPDQAAGCRCFGPYLGGARVRLAASALRRVLPLAYAREALDGSGRDMARALGVLPEHRGALVRALTAVLERQPQALRSLRAELARRRDDAAAALAFELAASLQEEIEAVSWTFADQKVALLDPEDLDVHGWAEGVLVRFEIREGRLETWTERPCPESTAAPLVAATPAPWRAFARRGAKLAADLGSVD